MIFIREKKAFFDNFLLRYFLKKKKLVIHESLQANQLGKFSCLSYNKNSFENKRINN